MALSLKNTAISLTLSGLLLFAGYLSGEALASAATTASFAASSAKSTVQGDANIGKSHTAKKAKRAFGSPYFSFGKSNLPTGAR